LISAIHSRVDLCHPRASKICSSGGTRQNSKRSGQNKPPAVLGDGLAPPEDKRKGCLTAAFVFALCMLAPMTASSDPREKPESSDGSRAARRGAGVSGVVRTASGQALRGVVVLAQSLDKPAPAIPDIAVTTDAAGNYSGHCARGITS